MRLKGNHEKSLITVIKNLNTRVRIFHGVNAVYKIAPWFPATSGFDSANSLSAVDSANVKRWGFNIVRLGVMWPGLEPNKRGEYDQSYLDSIEKIVKNLAAQDIYVILDMHQVFDFANTHTFYLILNTFD